MRVWLNELERINKQFEPKSRIKNPSSLEFAAEHAARTQDWTKQLAYLLRAILVDHAFEDGNKRTGAYLVFKFFEENKIPVDAQKVDRLLIKIASDNITNINKIRRQVYDATI